MSRAHFYPRPPRGGRRACCICVLGKGVISIHALREEGDSAPQLFDSLAKPISIHALREEGDTGGNVTSCGCKSFLSTPSARRATYHRTERHQRLCISIHALREEGDGLHRHAYRW